MLDFVKFRSQQGSLQRGICVFFVKFRSDHLVVWIIFYVVNLCEMKFYSDDVVVDKVEDLKLQHRMSMLMATLSRKQSLQTVLITSFGLRQGMYSGIFAHTVTLDDLFV